MLSLQVQYLQLPFLMDVISEIVFAIAKPGSCFLLLQGPGYQRRLHFLHLVVTQLANWGLQSYLWEIPDCSLQYRLHLQ